MAFAGKLIGHLRWRQRQVETREVRQAPSGALYANDGYSVFGPWASTADALAAYRVIFGDKVTYKEAP